MDFDPRCPFSALPVQIGDKWTGMIVLCLEDGPRRFGDLQRTLRRVTPKVLTETLRAMERDSLLTRRIYDENPPRVEYALTATGRRFLPLIAAVRTWSDEHLDAILDAKDTVEV